MSHPFDLTGKTAIVTGANTGLGQGMAVALAEAGANLTLVGRSAPSDTVELVEKLGRKAHVVMADLGSLDPIEKIVGETKEVFGGIDILVNNAGIIKRNDSIDFTPEDWDSVMNINVRTLFFLSQAVARSMIAAEKGGKIINIASMLSYQGGIRVPSYTTSKSGVMGLTRILANEWAQHGINVNAIAPGYFATNNTAALQADEKRNTEILGRIPSGRWGKPSDLGGAAVFLASAASDYVQGITLPVDGGWLAR
ncbi:2-dehydro-3-deoxy-D-gluconate 5-dehydrogenase KduD [Hirschia baltica]|uniref:2-dehydro-3-deoxy-D-gluconate 5-dehydrogenase n=1 Tax=Hirschia baltica (strain ATCC 49814 / DSM 5838 / IFAM 1418) TaxID=582402 RepID=C6XQI9_HIRBI|nr:2-dehydro-3-deoxy-D-gluconate 5-dehydrogenase KduD [Hirschia baltica]ACT60488.1 2-deoxy-D-gluconate 3-dehydrogenase [Hirschia baltica ATCC 49814]